MDCRWQDTSFRLAIIFGILVSLVSAQDPLLTWIATGRVIQPSSTSPRNFISGVSGSRRNTVQPAPDYVVEQSTPQEEVEEVIEYIDDDAIGNETDVEYVTSSTTTTAQPKTPRPKLDIRYFELIPRTKSVPRSTTSTTTTTTTTTTTSKSIVSEPNELSNELNEDTPSIYDLEQEQYQERRHECNRECIQGAGPKKCVFKFVVEWYHTMSKACYNCPYNVSDCYRSHCIASDGVKRPVITVNRQIPGPAIQVCHGDLVIVDVENRLGEESTSIHWHGQHQKGSPYMDGVPFVTQCPIHPKTTFRYTFNAAIPGTHFWHSHSGCQRADGAYGAFIVRTPSATNRFTTLYDLDVDEHTMVILDWVHDLGIARFTHHHHAAGNNKPDTLQINGRGRFKNFAKNNDSELFTPATSFSVTKGFRYRFRLINAGVLNCPIELSIDNHTLLVISSDGFDINPVKVDSLVSYAGERWDFILNANQPIGNYWMRFRGLMDCDKRFTSAHQVAVLRYYGSDSLAYPTASVSYDAAIRNGRVMNELNAERDAPSVSIAELSAADASTDKSLKRVPDQKIVVSFDFWPKDNPHIHNSMYYGFTKVAANEHRIYTPQLNQVSLKLPPFPLLSQHYDLTPDMLCTGEVLKNCNQTYCECTNVINLKLGEVVELMLIDLGVIYDANHPFHLHGHRFRVVAMDRVGRQVTVDEVLKLDREGKIERNLVSPPIKDTVTVPDGGYTIVRFVADNPGYWLFHCHIEFHVELGMALVFRVGDHSDFPPVPKHFPTCGNYLPPIQDEPVASAAPIADNNEIDYDPHGPKGEDSQVNILYWWPGVRTDRHSSPRYSAASAFFVSSTVIFMTAFNFLILMVC